MLKKVYGMPKLCSALRRRASEQKMIVVLRHYDTTRWIKAVCIFTSCPGVSSSCSSWAVGPNRVPCRVPCQASCRVPCRVRVGLVGGHHRVLVLSAGQEGRRVEVPVLLDPFVQVQAVQVVRRKVEDPGLRIRLCLEDPEGKD